MQSVQEEYVSTDLYKFQFEVFGHCMVFADSENDADDVLWSVAETPEIRHDAVGSIKVSSDARLDHLFDKEWVWFVTNLTA